MYADPEYRRVRAQLLAQHRREIGAWCPGAVDLNHLPHPTTDLTIDHLDPNGGHHVGNLRILCRSANSSRRRNLVR